MSAPILLPSDEDANYRVTTDASDYAIGATLEMLDHQGKVKGVVEYMSSRLHGSQLNWDIREKRRVRCNSFLRDMGTLLERQTL